MKGVDDVAAVLACVHEATEAKLGQMLADHRSGDAGDAGEFGDGFRTGGELPEQVEPGGSERLPDWAGLPRR